MVINFNNLKMCDLQPISESEHAVFLFLEEWLSHSKTVKIQTSGSTGTPKILEIEKSKMLESARMTVQFLKLKANNTALLCLPIDFISGKMMIARAFHQKMILHTLFPTSFPLIEWDTPIDFCAMTPLQVANSLDKIHLFKFLIIGGGAVSASLKKQIKDALKNNKALTTVYETFGMSETLSHIALKQIYPKDEAYFTTFDEVSIEKNENDCLVVHAPNLLHDKIVSNDIIDYKSPKKFNFLGRKDNVINSGGAKIFPEKLEALCKEYLANEVVFLGVEDDVLDERLIMVIEGRPSIAMWTTIEKIPFQKKFHHPKEIFFLPYFERTLTGKVNRKKILKQLFS